ERLPKLATSAKSKVCRTVLTDQKGYSFWISNKDNTLCSRALATTDPDRHSSYRSTLSICYRSPTPGTPPFAPRGPRPQFLRFSGKPGNVGKFVTKPDHNISLRLSI